MLLRRGALLFLKVIHQISRSRGTKKIIDFDPNWTFPDCKSSLNSLMAMKWCTKLEATQKRCPIVFQSHPSNSMVTLDKKLPILTRIERYRILTPVSIHPGLWNDAQSLCSIEEAPYCFWRSSIKFQCHTDKKSLILIRIGRFRTATQVWIHRWIWNDAQSLT